MKTLTHDTPTFFPQGPDTRKAAPDSYLTKLLLPLVLITALFGSALWYIFTVPSRLTPAAAPQARLELSLSGAYTSNLSLGQNELNMTQCGPSSFTLASRDGAVVPLTLSFNGAAAKSSQNSSFFVTGAQNALSLTLAGTPYTLLSGNVTVAPGIRTFYASFTDAQGQPLELSGRLVCP